MKRLLSVPCLAAALLAAGCATVPDVKLYEGPDRADGELSTVLVPYQVEISDINGTGVPGRMGLRHVDQLTYKLLPGRYTFRYRFTSPYEFGQDRQGISTPITGLVAEIEAGKSYTFKTKVKGPDATTAEVSVWLENAAGQRIDEPVAMDVPRPGTIRGVSPQPATPAPPGKAEAPAVPAASAPVAASPAPADSIEALKAGWEKATPDQRAEFLKWITRP